MSPTDHTAANPASGRHWLKISLFCPLPLLEPAADLMGVLSGSGVEQSPETEAGAHVAGFFPIEPGNAGDPDGAAQRQAIVDRFQLAMEELFALYHQVPGPPQLSLLADEDWATSWQQYFKPLAIVPGLVIKPSWETYVPQPGEAVIEMDPGMAFGTGQHASTQMALALIRASMAGQPATEALDVGTGTGILAMAAARFGARRVVAIDNDPDAVQVARDNIAHNHLTATIEVSTTPVAALAGTFPLVCANIVHDVLVEMAQTLAALTAPGGHLVLAGILSGAQEANIVRVYGQCGLTPLDRRYQDEWTALLLAKP